MMSSTLAHDAARGALFTMIAQAARILLQLISVAVLARLLTPHDYGMLAIVLVLVGLGEIFRDFGLTSASIQAPELSTGQRDNLFWINAAIGTGLGLLMLLASWPLGAITGESDIVGMAQWLSLLFVCNGLATQHRANLMREVRLRPLAIVDVAAAAIALAIAIAAALQLTVVFQIEITRARKSDTGCAVCQQKQVIHTFRIISGGQRCKGISVAARKEGVCVYHEDWIIAE